MIPVLIAALALIALAAAYVRRGVIVVHEGEVAVVFRLGRFERIARPGPTFLVPGIEHAAFVATSPRRVLAAGAGLTRDGVRVTTKVAVVVGVIAPLKVLKHEPSLEAQARDATSVAVAQALAELTTAELYDGGGALILAVRPRLAAQLATIGLGLESLLPGSLTFPAPLVGALGGIAVAAHERERSAIVAETERQVAALHARARAETLSRIDRVARTLDERTVTLERLEVLRAVAQGGGQVSVLTGLDDVAVRPAVPLAPPRLRDVS